MRTLTCSVVATVYVRIVARNAGRIRWPDTPSVGCAREGRAPSSALHAYPARSTETARWPALNQIVPGGRRRRSPLPTERPSAASSAAGIGPKSTIAGSATSAPNVW